MSSDKVNAIEVILNKIHGNVERKVSLSEAASVSGYEKTYLSKIFKKEAKISFQEYTTTYQMCRVAKMLRDTDYTISEISDKLGFSQPEALSHAFSNFCGCSPTDYQKNPDRVSLNFNKLYVWTYYNKEKGVYNVKRIDPASIIGDNFVKLLDLHPPAIILYCLIASYTASPTGMIKDFDPDSDDIPCFRISKSEAKLLPLSVDEIFNGIIELEDVDLLTIVGMGDEGFYVTINEIPDVLQSNGTLEAYCDFLLSQRDRCLDEN